MEWTLYLGVGLASLALPSLWWAMSGSEPIRVSRSGSFGDSDDLRQVVLSRSAQDRVVASGWAWLAGHARRFTPQGRLDVLEHKARLAGVGERWSTDRLLAVKILAGAAGAALGFMALLASPGLLGVSLMIGLPLLGFTSVDRFLGIAAAKRQAMIELKLADTLDQVTISVEAGLGLEAALARVVETGDGPVAEEFGRMLQDIQLGMARSDALDELLERTDVRDLRHFVLALRQAERAGIPVAKVLRVQSAELREKRRQSAEERAQKIPVKIVGPLIMFILPALMTVLLGPAVIRVLREFS